MLITFFIFVFTFVIYFFGISQSVFGGDGGDIILAAWFGGVAHPPGYPLNTMLGYLFTHLPIGGSVAYRADILAAFLQSANVLVIFLIVKKLTKRTLIALCASLVLAFNPLFWLYAHTVEVFQLKVLLVLVAQYFLLCWYEGKKKSHLYFSIMFLGLAVFHHTLTLLIIPAFAFLIYKNDKKIFSSKKTVLRAAGAFLVGTIPYIFIVFAAFRKTPINWDDPSNLVNLIRLATRADFGFFTATGFLFGQTLNMRLVQLLSFFGFMKNDFLIFGLLLMVCGFVYLFIKRRKLFWFYLLLTLLTGPIFLMYSGFPLTNDFIFGIWERFLMETYAYLIVPLAFGMLAIYELIKMKFNSKLFPVAAEISFLFLPLFMFFTNYSKADLSKFILGDQLGRDVFASANANSVIFFLNDTMTFNSQYIYYTENENPDKKVLLIGSLKYPYYRKQIMSAYPDLFFNDHFRSEKTEDSFTFIVDLVEENRDKHDFYSTGVLEIDKGRWIPSGLLQKLVKSDDNAVFDPKSIFAKFEFKNENLGYQHFFGQYIISLYYDSYVNAGNYLALNSSFESATEYFKWAIDLSPKINTAYVSLATAQIAKNQCAEAGENIEKAKLINSGDLSYLRASMIFERECNKDTEAAKKIGDLIENRTNSEKF